MKVGNCEFIYYEEINCKIMVYVFLDQNHLAYWFYGMEYICTQNII